VVDDATGLPLKTAVVLWRLGLPADAEWTEGDLEVGSADAGEGPARFEGLPAGRYRAHLPGKRMGSEDPPEFTHPGGAMEVVLRMRPPGSFRVRLRLFDEAGGSVTAAGMRRGRSTTWNHSPGPPDWARPRARRSGDPGIALGGGAGGSFGGRPAWRDVRDDGRGFDLGEVGESSTFRHPSTSVEIRVRDSLHIHVRVSGDLLADTDFVAPAPTREGLLRGLPVADADREAVKVLAAVSALPVPSGGDPGAWRGAPITVSATLEGAGEWRCTMTLDGAVPRWEKAE